MNLALLEENVKKIAQHASPETFIFDLLLAYGKPKATISRLLNGSSNQAKNNNEVVLKKSLYFRKEDTKSIYKIFEDLKKSPSVKKMEVRFIIVTDFNTLLAYDTKVEDGIEVEFSRLNEKFDFFLPWSGYEKRTIQSENPVDIKAAEKLAKFFDLIKADNPKEDPASLHSLNVFLTRLLFCLFAEDTEIFEKSSFTTSFASHTKEEGSDSAIYFEKLFDVLNSKSRNSHSEYFNIFPYVNGGLFAKKENIPNFSRRSRNALIELGDLNWAEINPDIFGSMIQAVVHAETRHELGMHYTSVTNIMKVIEPLFLNSLKDELVKCGNNKTKLSKLLERVHGIKVFDPACGSGNFLIIAYKELRSLEMKILKGLGEMSITGISLSNFYGIEIDDFAHEVAILSLWLVEHQMNLVFRETFGQSLPSLPLKGGGNIICGNATRVDWEKACPKKGEEIYILGNPPYLGSKVQKKNHKDDMKEVFKGVKKYKDLDYISCWFYKAANYIKNTGHSFAFVSTNSICQGIQVSMLWPHIDTFGLEISFAYPSFKWMNNAKNKAGVTCSIIGVRKKTDQDKFIYASGISRTTKNINAYLTSGSNIIIGRRSKPLCSIPRMDLGNAPYDGGFLILSPAEKEQLLDNYPQAEKFVKKLYGSNEYIKGTLRYCIWITNSDRAEAEKIPPIRERIQKVEATRIASKDKGTNKLASRPHQFREMKYAKKHLLLVSRVSSERREYIPMGILDSDSIIADAQVIYDPEYYMFGLLCSRLHMVWVKATSGCLESRIRYSSALSYNNFPVPDLSKDEKQKIIDQSLVVISEREKYPEKTMAELYDPDKMPQNLKLAHEELDRVVEICYRVKLFGSDEERLEYLFSLYEKIAKGNKNAKSR